MSADESAAWAKGILVTGPLLPSRSTSDAASEPRIAVQSAVGNVILCDAPVECYSKSTPVFTPRSPSEKQDWRPIDVLYGTYNPKTRCIEIYVDNIRRDAALYGEYADVLQIVRLHEYAHAMVHLGVRVAEVETVLGRIGEAGVTDWDYFVEKRTRAFAEIDSASHELLAQAITFAVIATLPDDSQRQRLTATFEALEKTQPPEYVVSKDLKDVVLHAVDWSLVVAAARREIDLLRGDGFSLRDGLAALVRDMGVCQESASVQPASAITLSHETEASGPPAPLINHLCALKDALRRSVADVTSGDSGALIERAEQIGALRQQLGLYASLLGSLSENIKATLEESETQLVKLMVSGSEGHD